MCLSPLVFDFCFVFTVLFYIFIALIYIFLICKKYRTRVKDEQLKTNKHIDLEPGSFLF